jgi:hypothetical protein
VTASEIVELPPSASNSRPARSSLARTSLEAALGVAARHDGTETPLIFSRRDERENHRVWLIDNIGAR